VGKRGASKQAEDRELAKVSLRRKCRKTLGYVENARKPTAPNTGGKGNPVNRKTHFDKKKKTRKKNPTHKEEKREKEKKKNKTQKKNGQDSSEGEGGQGFAAKRQANAPNNQFLQRKKKPPLNLKKDLPIASGERGTGKLTQKYVKNKTLQKRRQLPSLGPTGHRL